jgi:hypothetical protein
LCPIAIDKRIDGAILTNSIPLFYLLPVAPLKQIDIFNILRLQPFQRPPILFKTLELTTAYLKSKFLLF